MSNYGFIGDFQRAIAEPAIPAKLLHYRKAGDAIAAAIHEGEIVRLLHLHSPDHPELMKLGDCDRATLQGALIAMQREVTNA